jgi:hypothetical protein
MVTSRETYARRPGWPFPQRLRPYDPSEPRTVAASAVVWTDKATLFDGRHLPVAMLKPGAVGSSAIAHFETAAWDLLKDAGCS